MSLHQRISQFLPPRIAQLARYSRPRRQPPPCPCPSASKSAPRAQTRAFRASPRRLAPEQPPSPKTTTTTTTATAAAETATTTTSTKLDRILARLPRPLRGYTSRLRSAPVSHVVAFLILHEITAIVPLLALFGIFHYYTPTLSSSGSSSSWAEYILAHYGSSVSDGIARFERYFTRKGWFGFGFGQTQSQSEQAAKAEQVEGEKKEEHKEEVIRRWESGAVADGKYRILVEIALAYALTKALLPVRIVASVSATPWFAGVLARLRNVVGAAARRKKP